MRARRVLALLVAVVAGATAASAGDAPSPAAPAATTPRAGAAIRWARSWTEARDEAAERNALIFLHSHGSTCPPCKGIHRAVFEDPAYVAWANERTVHLLSYALDRKAEGPEPTVEVARDGAKVTALAAFPMFTAGEAEDLVNEIDKHVKFTLHTPFAGVIALDGTTILASTGKGTAKQYRELYEAEQQKLGPPLARETWQRAVAQLEASAAAEFDERWREAVVAGLEARRLVPSPSAALRDRIETRVDALDKAGAAALARAQATKDPAARAKALETVRADFAGLPCVSAK